jgi:16S rRNA (adenine1518-N6/adenine1519-N6)-dimethyltransferase
VRPKKSLSQNFLFDPGILKRIVDASGAGPEDTVVEVGPGPGTLTKILLSKVKEVVAIEADKRFYEKLREELSEYENVKLFHADALKFDYSGLPKFKAVANIPYHITTPLLFKLLSQKNLTSMTLTIQKEVAQRIAAGPGSKTYGVLSIMVQYRARAELKFIIPAGAFRPVPKVDSACIRLDVYERPPVKVKDEETFFRLVKAAFSQRRKTITNAIKVLINEPKEFLEKAGIDPKRRPETLSMEDFARLADVVHWAG